MPLATRRINDDTESLLSQLRLDRVAAARPRQLAERAQLHATLAPPDAAELKQEAARAAELAKAERDVELARVALERACDRVSNLWRASHGQSHLQNTRDQDLKAKLRSLAHPIIPYVELALRNAGFAAMAVRPTVAGVETTETPIEPNAEEARRSWFKPTVLLTRQPVSTHSAQVAFLAAISEARAHVEGLQYEDLSDDDVVAKLRAEIDALVATRPPLALEHVRMGLVELRRKLAAAPLDLWQINEARIA
jgi:hypothetical protein